jgi:hypothetical protein
VEVPAALDHRLQHAVALGEQRQQRDQIDAAALGTGADDLHLGAGGVPTVERGGRRLLGGHDEGRRQRRVEQRTGRGHPAAGVEQHPERRAGDRLLLEADGQARLVGDRGAGADDHRLGLCPQPVGVGAGRRAGDPLRAAVGGGGAAVEAHRRLEERERPPRRALVQVGRERRRDHVGGDSGRHPDPRVLQPADAPPRDPAVGVVEREHHVLDAGCHERLGARRRVAVVVARLEGDVGGRPTGPVAGGAQRRDLGVRPVRVGTGGALADDLAVAHEHAADPRVRRGIDARRLGQGCRPPHQLLVGSAHARCTSRAHGVQPAAARHAHPRLAGRRRALSHPDCDRRPETLTRSAHGWLPQVRGLPPSGGHRRSGLPPAPRGRWLKL